MNLPAPVATPRTGVKKKAGGGQNPRIGGEKEAAGVVNEYAGVVNLPNNVVKKPNMETGGG